MHALIHGRTLRHLSSIIRRRPNRPPQAHFLNVQSRHLVFMGRHCRDLLLSGKAIGSLDADGPSHD